MVVVVMWCGVGGVECVQVGGARCVRGRYRIEEGGVLTSPLSSGGRVGRTIVHCANAHGRASKPFNVRVGRTHSLPSCTHAHEHKPPVAESPSRKHRLGVVNGEKVSPERRTVKHAAGRRRQRRCPVGRTLELSRGGSPGAQWLGWGSYTHLHTPHDSRRAGRTYGRGTAWGL